MKLIIGLGNPGKKYEMNRHNAGFMFVDYLLEKNKGKPFKFDKYLSSEWTEIKMKEETYVLAKPHTFMNDSGKAVNALSTRFLKTTTDYKLLASSLLVAHDDLDIPLDKFHIQVGRGPKVHNGLESIENHFKTKDFTRIRIGVDSRTPEKWIDGETYVLQDFSEVETERLRDTFVKIVELI